MATVTNWRSCTLTILSAATESEEVNLEYLGVRKPKMFQIEGPTTLAETVAIHVGNGVGGTYKALSSGGSDITIPAAKAISTPIILAKSMKLVAGAGVAADRVFIVMGAAVK